MTITIINECLQPTLLALITRRVRLDFLHRYSPDVRTNLIFWHEEQRMDITEARPCRCSLTILRKLRSRRHPVQRI